MPIVKSRTKTLTEEEKKKKELEKQKSIEATEEMGKIQKAINQKAINKGQISPPQVPVEQFNQQRQETTQQLQTAGAFEQTTPTEVSLQPPPTLGSSIPVIGPATTAIQAAIGNSLKFLKGPKAETGETAFPIPETPETNREEALRIIRKKSFEKGISAGEVFGTFVESIPIAGKFAAQYASGLLETPSSNAQDVLGEINKIKEAASTGQEKVRNGLEDPDYGLDRARQMEENIAELEGRIKLLVITSPVLRANTDNVNLIQEQILEAKEKVNRYKTASSFGLTAQLTGTGRIIPTDEQIYLELRDLQNEK